MAQDLQSSFPFLVSRVEVFVASASAPTNGSAKAAPPKRSFSDKMLDGIEMAGNKVPHPVLLFLYLIIGVIILSHILYWAGVSVTESIAVPVADSAPGENYSFDYYEDTSVPSVAFDGNAYGDEYVIEERTIAIRSLLTMDGIRFLFTSFVPNFTGFAVVGITFIAMMGAGVAEAAGLMSALIRLLVQAAPRRLITFIIIFVGVLSSVATDAGYLILVPLGATAFVTLKKHPLAGMASAFAGVGAVFAVNLLITPLDSMLTEITNEAIGSAGGTPITVLANFFFAVVASFFLALIVTLVTEFVTNPRLGEYTPEAPVAAASGKAGKKGDKPAAPASDPAVDGPLTALEKKGLRRALYAFLAFTLLIVLMVVPSWGPLRDPVTGDILGNTPFMDSLVYIITLFFLLAGIAYGFGTGAFKSANDVIAAITKTFSTLAGMILMLLVISQFIAYFNFSNMPTIAAINMADLLERANIGALPLLIGFVLVIVLLDIIMPGAVPKWAIFAPVFIPIFLRLNVSPQTLLAAYRVGDSPMNVVTPLMVYLPFVVTIAQRYQKNAGLGTVVALMLPYTLAVLLAFLLFFIVWFLLGIPLGPGYPVGV